MDVHPETSADGSPRRDAPGDPKLQPEPPAGKLPVVFDPDLCEREAIHIPGAIQPHGALLATRPSGWRITHCSANLAEILGRTPHSVLGTHLASIVGPAAQGSLRDLRPYAKMSLGRLAADAVPGSAVPRRTLQLSAFHSGDRVCIDFEPVRLDAGQQPPEDLLRSVLDSFKSATSQDSLCALAVAGLQTISGYDRVMAYRFDRTGPGSVVAEAHAPHLESWLGRRYPASDIPAQARRQYMLQRVGAVADSRYEPVPLLTGRRLEDATPLDLTYSALRSVSPVHREFMCNMGTAASLTVGLSHGPDLWGLLICHHAAPRVAGPDLRAAADLIGQVVSLLLGSLNEAESFAARNASQTTLHDITERLSRPEALAEALGHAHTALLRLVGATGVAVRIGGVCRCYGQTPGPVVAADIVTVLQAVPRTGNDLIAVDGLSRLDPKFASFAAIASGALLLTLDAAAEDVILWLRPERSRTTTWGGNPDAHGSLDRETGRITPRTSFAAWIQSIAGQCDPWSAIDETLAHDLQAAIGSETEHRTNSEQAWLEHYRKLSDSLEQRVLQRTQILEAETQARQRADAILQQAQKMEAIGQITGGVAHDFNNMLAVVLGNLELTQARTSDPVMKRFIANAQQAAERGAKLTDHLLAFARKQPLRREPCDLNRLTTDFAELVRRTVGAGIEVRLALTEPLWPVMLDATQFEMALLNLAVNAGRAMPQGGVLEIATRNIAAGDEELPADLEVGDYTCVTVRDDGAGMHPEVAARAFEPFYTTSAGGKSTGLGLSQVYGLCKQLGGSTRLTSRIDGGTSVSLLLPRAQHAPAASAVAEPLPPAPPACSPPGDARLLVIDDDPEVREVTVETLRALGFDVVSAESAKLGLDILQSGVRLDLVVTDFSMPEMNGVEFIRHAHRSHPGLPCLLVTGYAETSAFADAIAGGITILRKPYRMRELADTIQRLRA